MTYGLSPSWAHVWAHCPGSVRFVQLLPEINTGEMNQYRAEGIAVHELCARFVNAATRVEAMTAPQCASNGIVYTSEMIENATEFALDVQRVMRAAHVAGGPNLGIEEPFPVPSIHPNMTARPDVWLIDKSHGHIHVWDYKNGYRRVSAVGNRQALCYLAGLLDKPDMIDLDYTFFFHLHQPHDFSEPVKVWSEHAGELRNEINKLRRAADKAMDTKGASIVAGSQCAACPGIMYCPVAIEYGVRMFECMSEPRLHNLSPQALSLTMDILCEARDQISALLSGYESRIKSEIRKGQPIPGYELTEAYGHLDWSLPPEGVIEFGKLMGYELSKPGVITPRQAAKRGVPESALSGMAARPVNGLKLKRSDPASDEAEAVRIFSQS